jgi:hypothetical protein
MAIEQNCVVGVTLTSLWNPELPIKIGYHSKVTFDLGSSLIATTSQPLVPCV